MSEWNLKNHGDLLEFRSYEFVEATIPAYEQTWAIYIGHNGKGQAADLMDSNGKVISRDDPRSIDRDLFSQYHYTILEALYGLERMRDLNPQHGPYPFYDQAFLDVQDNFILFHAHLGRARDAIVKACEILKLKLNPSDNDTLKKIWDPRNIVLHGPRVPFTWFQYDAPQDTFIIEPVYNEADGWSNEKRRWSEYSENSKMVVISEYLDEKRVLANVFASSLLSRMNSRVHEILKTEGIHIAPPAYDAFHTSFGISGYTGSDSWKNSIVRASSGELNYTEVRVSGSEINSESGLKTVFS